MEVDKQGRILIPANLRDFAGLVKDVVMVGVASRIEIWSREKWEALQEEEEESVEDIADFCNINRSYLNRLFKESTGKTLQNFLMYYRMNRAAELLKVSELTVNEIGKRCGYQNQLHFSRAFKTIFGLSPMQWKKKEKEEGEL